jgi:hypothetical protein
LALYRALLAVRRDEPAMRAGGREALGVGAIDEATIAVARGVGGSSSPGQSLLFVVRLSGRGTGTADLTDFLFLHRLRADGPVVLTTEDRGFGSGEPPTLASSGADTIVDFPTSGAIIVRCSREGNV